MPKAKTLDDRVDQWSGGLQRFPWLAVSTLGMAVFSFWLGEASKWWYLPAALGLVACAVLTALISAARERLASREKQKAVSLAEELWGTFTGGGAPAIDALGHICGGTGDLSARKSALLQRVLDATRARLGRERVHNRAIFYERTGPDTLTLVDWIGRQERPRHTEWRRDDPVGRAKLEFLDGDGSAFEDRPDATLAPGFAPAGAGYKSYLIVRVVAGGERLGILCVDSPQLNNFTVNDQSGISLLAGLLAAGWAAAKAKEAPERPSNTGEGQG